MRTTQQRLGNILWPWNGPHMSAAGSFCFPSSTGYLWVCIVFIPFIHIVLIDFGLESMITGTVTLMTSGDDRWSSRKISITDK